MKVVKVIRFNRVCFPLEAALCRLGRDGSSPPNTSLLAQLAASCGQKLFPTSENFFLSHFFQTEKPRRLSRKTHTWRFHGTFLRHLKLSLPAAANGQNKLTNFLLNVPFRARRRRRRFPGPPSTPETAAGAPEGRGARRGEAGEGLQQGVKGDDEPNAPRPRGLECVLEIATGEGFRASGLGVTATRDTFLTDPLVWAPPPRDGPSLFPFFPHFQQIRIKILSQNMAAA